MIKPLRLRRQARYNPLDDRVHRAGKPFDICDNAVVYGVYRLRRRQRARAAHRRGHITFNAGHIIFEAYANAVRHVPADFGENR
ncbi:hypothetical protein SDC9_176439 [bioreactor metagenome]|uniref:Uncharacterized protein n=1 Tax=bioreactor metagenome TaxID=1076179 RepID=A0A645GSR6_9ZZZZ